MPAGNMGSCSCGIPLSYPKALPLATSFFLDHSVFINDLKLPVEIRRSESKGVFQHPLPLSLVIPDSGIPTVEPYNSIVLDPSSDFQPTCSFQKPFLALASRYATVFMGLFAFSEKTRAS